MAYNWWETESSLPPGVAEFQRNAERRLQLLILAGQQAAQQAGQQAQPQQVAQQQDRAWEMPAWLQLLRHRPMKLPQLAGEQRVLGGAFYPLSIAQTLMQYAQQAGQGPEPAEGELAQPGWEEYGEIPFEQIVGETYEQRATDWLKKVFTGRAEHWGEEHKEEIETPFGTYTTPDWVSRFNAALERMLSTSGGRVLRAWERPEKRALLGGEPSGLGTAADLEVDEDWLLTEARKRGIPTEDEIATLALTDPTAATEALIQRQNLLREERERRTGNFFESAWEHVTTWIEHGQHRRDLQMELAKPGLSDSQRSQLQEELDSLGQYPWLGKIWEELTARSEGARTVERLAATGLQLIQEPAFHVIEMGAILDILQRPESRNLTVEQWMPLTRRASSFYWAKIKEGFQLDWLRNTQGWSNEQYAAARAQPDVIARALIDIADGTATAEEIALANEKIGAEIVGQIILDPLNLLFAGAARGGQRLTHLSDAVQKMTDIAASNPEVAQVLKVIEDAVAAGNLAELRQMERALAARNISLPRRVLNRLGEIAHSPVELIPEAKAARDLEDITIVLAPAIDVAGSGEDAIQLLRMWADEPASLAPIFGRVPQSRAGRKAGIVLKATIDHLAEMPSARIVPFNPARFWADFEQVARAALLEVYGFKEPGPVLKFFMKYKRFQSEFYLNPAMGGFGYAFRNLFGDLSGAALDGLATFDGRTAIDNFFRSFSTGREEFVPLTRRVMTEGAENIEGLTGAREIKSVFPGALGEYSKAGQRLTRYGELGGRIPIGEESRYTRALYAAMKHFWTENAPRMLPDLPPSTIAQFGDQAEHLHLAVAHETSLAVRRQIVSDFLDGTKGAQFEPTRYLDSVDMDAISPEIMGRLRQELRKFNKETPVDEIHRMMRDIMEAVDEDEAARLAAMQDLPPSLHVTTDVSEAEAADELVQALEDIVARTGDESQARRIQEIQETIPEVERAIDDARVTAVDDLLTEPGDEGLEILMRANADVEDSQAAWRRQLDELRNRAIAEYRRPPGQRRPADEIWADCFKALDEGWTAKAHERINIYQRASTQLERLRAGERLETILGEAARTRRAEKWLLKASELPEPPANYIPGNVYRGASEDDKFAALLAYRRAKLDNVRTNAWRAVYGSDSSGYGKVLDLLDSADRDVELWGKQTSAEIRRLYSETQKEVRRLSKVHKDPHMLQWAIDQAYEKYWAARHDTWNKFWTGAEQRWQIAERDILLENWAYGQRMEPPVQPPKRRGPRRPHPGPVQEGDEVLVRRAALKDIADWSADERKAVSRWTAAGQKLPEKELPIIPGIRGAPAYTRSQFVADLKKVIPDEQVDAAFELFDRMASTWSKQTGHAPEEWYAMLLAGTFRGMEPEFTMFQRAPHWLDPQFKEWFGASVLREDFKTGKPMTLYRGQRHTTDYFRVSDEGFIWLTDNPEYAEFIATKGFGRWTGGEIPTGAQIYPVHAKMEMPIDLSAAHLDLPMDEFEEVLKETLKGYFIEYGVDTTTINALIPGSGGLFGARSADTPFLWVRLNRDALLEHAFAYGYDGIILAEDFPDASGAIKTATSYIVFEPNQVKTVWNFTPTDSPYLLYQGTEFAPRWWYKAEEIVAAKMPNRADIQQVRNIITKGGIKKDELRWSGVEWWLNNQEGTVTRDEVLGFLESQRLEVKEIVRGRTTVPERLTEAHKATSVALDQAAQDIAQALAEAGVVENDASQLIYLARELNSPTARAEIEQLAPGTWKAYEQAFEQRNAASTALQKAKDEVDRYVPVWSKYVEPGAVDGSYRELELILPERLGEQNVIANQLRDLNDQINRTYDELGRTRQEAWIARNRGGAAGNRPVPPELEQKLAQLEDEWARLHEEQRALQQQLLPPLEHQEPHWQNERNVVAHVRMSERQGPNGERFLWIDELQSQWHQTGRQKGYIPAGGWPENWAVRIPSKEEVYGWEEVFGLQELRYKTVQGEWGKPPGERIWLDRVHDRTLAQAGEDLTITSVPTGEWRLMQGRRLIDKFSSLEDAKAAALELAPTPNMFAVLDEKGMVLGIGETPSEAKAHALAERVPEAPFAQSWDELCLKRMLRWAAEEDYDAIAWTSGAQQVRRYPMEERTVATNLEWVRRDDGTIDVTGYDYQYFEGKRVFQATFDDLGNGKILKQDTTLEKAFGKEIAEDMRAGAPGHFYNADVGELVVGDTRLADLYDRIFPYSANKLTKRWQTKVEPLELNFGARPNLRLAPGFQGWVVLNEDGLVISKEFGSRTQAQQFIDGLCAKTGTHTTWGISLSDGMKRDLLHEGLALYQPGKINPKAAMSILEDGRAVLRFFEGADFSSVIHEMSHVLRRILPDGELRIVEQWAGVQPGDFDRLYELAVEHQALENKAARTSAETARMKKLAPQAKQYVEAEEKFARGFERYLAEGIAPIPELQLPFRKMKGWLLETYQEIKGSSIDVDLTDEVRDVFDRLIAGDEAQARVPLAEGRGGPPGAAPPSRGVTLLQEGAGPIADKPGLAQAALDRIPDEGWTLDLNGIPYEGEGWAVSLPGAEKPLPKEQATVESVVVWLDEHEPDFAIDPTLKFGGWTEGDNVVLDISTIIDDDDLAMVQGWEWNQRAIYSFKAWASTDVTYEAAQEAAQRLGITLQRAPGEPPIPLVGPDKRLTLAQEAATSRQYGFWDWDPDNWAEYRRALNSPGATPGPLPPDLLQRSTEATRRALGKIEDGIAGDWDQWQEVFASQEARADLDNWFNQEVVPSWYEQRAVSLDYARSEADFALLDYSHRYNFDQWLSTIIPYHYWFTRSGWNWAKRLAGRPGLLGAYIRMMDGLKLANERAGRRQRFATSFAVPAPWLPEWMGDKLYVDPRSMIAPYSQIFQTNWDDAEESKQGLNAIYDTARQFGLRPYHIWDYLYQAGKFRQMGELLGMAPEEAQRMLGPEYEGNFPTILPQTGVIRAASALAREAGAEAVPPGGFNIEGPLRRVLGLPSGEIWDPYRINRMLANLAAEQSQNMQLAQAALRAQELVERDEDQTGRPWYEGSELAQQTAQEMGWTPEQLAEAQELLATALQRASLERGVGSIGWLTGPRLSVEPAGERAQLEMAEEARGTAWTPEQPEGSREAYEQFKRENPAMYPRATQYAVMPGEEQYETLSPGYRANWLILREQKDMLHEAYDQAVDDALRREPWNWDLRDDLEDQRRVALAELEEKYPMPEYEGNMPAILYGMNPDEMWSSTVEKVLYRIQANKPDPARFEEEGGVNWDAYYKAEAKWYASLPSTFPFGVPEGGLYQGLDPETAMRNFEQRYDSPLEAAYKTYQSEIARPAWDEYNKIKAQWEEQWPGLADLEDHYWALDKENRRALVQQNPQLKEYWDWKDQQPNTYQQTVGKVGEMNATALIPAILARYRTRGWTEEQLRQELTGVVFPALAKQQELKRGTVAAQGTATAQGTAAAPSATTSYQRPGYTPAELARLRRLVEQEWARAGARRGRSGGGGGRSSGYKYPRWRPPSTIRGGPWQF